MLQGSYQSVLEAQSRDDFRREVVRFTKQLGFDTVSAVTVVDHPVGDTEFVAVDNAPAAYSEMIDDTESWKLDPVLQHCKRQSVPIIWDQSTYVTAGQGSKWEGQARFGFRTGICLALHMPEGRHFMIGVDRDQALPKDRGEVTRMVADLQLFAVHAQDTAMRVLVPESLRLERPKLSPRELDSLKWTMDGKTAWEVGSIMGISERTAVLHINTAMHKLGCQNKHQAVLKALRLGILR
ncbi:MAG TPA: autoinducer binding domain-containing protein [Methylibium sp.]|uniref:autoinducer binding domain-containing protein n=1 Tax=Methylibium sp. TaxID=2067992 RepID=UPI002DBE0137|nr:autoinducer binding domain-containing protein [Methylibium sp.]HEU4459496.1 autoinducer binding domain-containing protein [Methylibium sp.]